MLTEDQIKNLVKSAFDPNHPLTKAVAKLKPITLPQCQQAPKSSASPPASGMSEEELRDVPMTPGEALRSVLATGFKPVEIKLVPKHKA